MNKVSATISEEEINRLAINFRIIKFVWECLEKENYSVSGNTTATHFILIQNLNASWQRRLLAF